MYFIKLCNICSLREFQDKSNSWLSAFSPLGSHAFLHRVNTSEVKIRPVLKKSYFFHKVENMES